MSERLELQIFSQIWHKIRLRMQNKAEKDKMPKFNTENVYLHLQMKIS